MLSAAVPGAARGTWRGEDLVDRAAELLGAGGLAALVGLTGIAVVCIALVLRDRFHRRRVNLLFVRLEEIEHLSQLSGAADGPALPDPSSPAPSPKVPDRPTSIRGRLSTAISSLRRQAGGGPGAPSRLDIRVIRYLYAHLDRPVSPSEIASEFNLSLRTLERQLTATLGCSPRDLIAAVKMHEAKRRLMSGEWRVQEAARTVGFDDASHFSKRFRAYYGVSPSQVRDEAS